MFLPLPAVSWSLSEQRDWLSERSEAGLHLSVIGGDGDLSRSPPPLEGGECFMLPLATPLLQVQSLSCMASWETESHSHITHVYIYL